MSTFHKLRVEKARRNQIANDLINYDEIQLNDQYIAGLYDGDGSICIGKCTTSGFQLKVELSQSHKKFLEKVNMYLGDSGKIYTDKRSNQNFEIEPNAALRICGKKALHILNIIKEYGVLHL